MPQSLALVLVHIIFSTKNRMAFLQSTELRSEVRAYLTGTLRGLQCEPLQVGGMEDHVPRRVSYLSQEARNFRSMSVMCGIDQIKP